MTALVPACICCSGPIPLSQSWCLPLASKGVRMSAGGGVWACQRQNTGREGSSGSGMCRGTPIDKFGPPKNAERGWEGEWADFCCGLRVTRGGLASSSAEILLFWWGTEGPHQRRASIPGAHWGQSEGVAAWQHPLGSTIC